MGIKGLWPKFGERMEDANLADFKDQRVGVDMFVWIHRNLFGLPSLYLTDAKTQEPLEGVNMNVVRVVAERICRRVESLQQYGVVPVCVFDGRPASLKKEELQKRAAADRGEAKKKSCGGDAARRPVSAAVQGDAETQLTSRIPLRCVRAIIARLTAIDVECIQAPFEADPQLAYLCRTGYIDAVLSVDGDLIAYYCPCTIKDLPKEINWKTGACRVVRPRDCAPGVCRAIAAGASATPTAQTTTDGDAQRRASSLRDSILREMYDVAEAPGRLVFGDASIPAEGPFTYESFLLSCVMCGCDYVDNIPSIGIVRAFRLVQESSSLDELFATVAGNKAVCAKLGNAGADVKVALDRIRRRMLDAFYCFAHHLVYCPKDKRVVPFHPLPTVPDKGRKDEAVVTLRTDLVGEMWDAQTAEEVCVLLTRDPITLRLYHGTQ